MNVLVLGASSSFSVRIAGAAAAPPSLLLPAPRDTSFRSPAGPRPGGRRWRRRRPAASVRTVDVRRRPGSVRFGGGARMAAGAGAAAGGRSFSFKVVLLGEGCVGKTSLVLRYCENKFNDKHITTLQVRAAPGAGWGALARSYRARARCCGAGVPSLAHCLGLRAGGSPPLRCCVPLAGLRLLPRCSGRCYFLNPR